MPVDKGVSGTSFIVVLRGHAALYPPYGQCYWPTVNARLQAVTATNRKLQWVVPVFRSTQNTKRPRDFSHGLLLFLTALVRQEGWFGC
jgi:hypothetical protein